MSKYKYLYWLRVVIWYFGTCPRCRGYNMPRDGYCSVCHSVAPHRRPKVNDKRF